MEVRCGIERSPCSVACPSGTIYTSLWPHLCIELCGSTWLASVGWPLSIEFGCAYQSNDATAGMDASIFLLLLLPTLPTAVLWRVVVEEGAPWLCSVFFGFDVHHFVFHVEDSAWAKLRDLADRPGVKTHPEKQENRKQKTTLDVMSRCWRSPAAGGKPSFATFLSVVTSHCLASCY